MPVRSASSADLPAIRHIVEATDMFPGELLADMIAPFLAGTTPAFWQVESTAAGVRAVAYVAPEPLTEGTWNLLMIAVDPIHQGKGVGGELMRHVERRLSIAGERLLLVETSDLPDFARTRDFYAGRGYREVARIPAFYGPVEGKVVFWKALTTEQP